MQWYSPSPSLRLRSRCFTNVYDGLIPSLQWIQKSKWFFSSTLEIILLLSGKIYCLGVLIQQALLLNAGRHNNADSKKKRH